MDLRKIASVFDHVMSNYRVVYADFNREEFAPYRERKIGGFVRLDEKTIYIHSELSREERELTLLHEVLSIYYYEEKILRHDEEIEDETRKLYKKALPLLQRYIN